MKYKSVYLNKILLADLLKIVSVKNIDVNNYYVAYPDREKDQRVFKRIWLGTFKAMISHIRILWKHKNFFRKIKICVENGAIDRLIKKGIISEEVIDRLIEKLKSEEEVLRYILKFNFIPLEEELLPDGRIVERVSSQAFDDLDELLADDLFNKSYNFLADLFDVSIQEFNKW